ncbi:hypothetical protein JG688_00014696 [Phytophthora aleatoria]|uniref:Uncharacterized protein n=1 Tax=Phytophthora aleatoria TaxID=2496075 RepID=A0A8J5I7E2_9STRA|nr:hypothetical protein JG688_00014696 [Phytophthora aleatoria]
MKWLHEVVRSRKYGSNAPDVAAQLKHLITNMTYATTEEDYKLKGDELKSLSCRDGVSSLWDYFVTNWDSCVDMWVMLHRFELPHFNNHTNNRVESLYGKSKQNIKSHFTMQNCLEALLAMQEEYRAHAGMPGPLRDTSYSEMNIVLGMTTRWVVSAIEGQYKVEMAKKSLDRYTFTDNETSVTVRSKHHEYLLQKDGWICYCEFAQTMKLPR